jgi:hypothetical protein
VGGFAASDWLYHNLKAAFTSQGLDVSRPDSHVCVTLFSFKRTALIWNYSLATKLLLTALYPSTLITSCQPESQSLLMGQACIANIMPMMMNIGVESARRS